MPSTTSETGDTSSSPDFETLKNHVKTLRDDLTALLHDAGAFARDKAKAYAAKGSAKADGAGEKAAEYREVVVDKVREHPLAAVGIALAAGAVLASLSRK